MPDSSSLSGRTISHYHVLEKLGAGGMGDVYRAHDDQLDRDVALKVLPAGTLSDEAARKQFRKEALALAKLNHPNIETVHEFGTQEGVDFLAMELIAGSSLNQKLRGGPLDEREIVRLGMQFAGGLAAAHEQGVVHRDLKPANVMVTPDGWLKILDFGLAKLIHRDVLTDITRSITMESGTISGTVPYMAPEQLRGLPVDPRADIYAAGAVLYEMTTGRRPFPQLQSAELMGAILHQPAAPPSSINPGIAPGLENVILKALEKEPSQRYQSARELLVALEGISFSVVVSTTRAQSARAVVAVTVPAVASPIARAGRYRWVLAAGAAGVTALSVVAYLYLHQAPKLTEKDTIVLADFANTTGDGIFDDTLRQGLASQLEQSPFLNLLSDERVAQTLALMAQPKDARLTRELAREVCQRTASAVSIEGSISSLGSQYVVGLKAVTCRIGDVLANEQATASGKEQVLKALGEAATKVRVKLGESLASVQRYDSPAENVTTPSLEALQAYSLGYQTQIVKNDNAAAIPLFQRAISLDPNFAMAFARLGTNYSNLGETAHAAENIRRAYALRERVSEREKFYIVSHYETYVTGNLEAARKTYELWAQTYPRDAIPITNLAAIQIALGDYDHALVSNQKALKLSPESGLNYTNLVTGYLQVSRLDEARATAQEAQAHNLDNPQNHQYLYVIDFLQHDAAGMEREAAALMGKPGFEDYLLYVESDIAAYAGQFSKARELTRRASESARRADEKETAAGYEAEAAMREALVGNMSLAKHQAQAALALSTGRDAEAISAFALGLASDPAQTTRQTADLATRFPEDTFVQFNYLPTIHAAIALQEGSASKAIEALAPAAPYELGFTALPLYPVYLRGEAYLAAHQGSAASAEFQKILAHPGVVLNNPIGALAHLGLGRAYTLSGDALKARAAYQDFLALWKGADPDIPILQQAKAEYAKLR